MSSTTDNPPGAGFPGLTDIHAHPAMNAFLWDRDLRRHYCTGRTFNPLASLTDFKMLEKGGLKVLWSSLHIPEPDFFRCPILRFAAHFTGGGRKLLKLNAWECLRLMMAKMERQVASADDLFEIARSNDALDRVLATGKTAIVHTVEGGHVLGAGLDPDDLPGRLVRLDTLARDGVASLTLAHLFPNDLAGHAEAIPAEQRKLLRLCRLDSRVDPKRGLTATGGAVVERMIELRIVPDVTHCTPVARQEIYDLVANRAPVIASHTGVRSLNPEPYNLDESDVRAIAEAGGIVGVIFMPYWLHESHPKSGLDAIWGTMDTVRRWSGGSWNHVAIGTDFDGFTDPPDDCDSEAQLPLIRELLESNGVSGNDAEAVLGGNARRVLRNGWR
jgi:membrane dipeptidase